MTFILSFLLTLILNYGYPIIVLCVLLAYLGIPIPTNAIVVAAGSFSVNGSLHIFILLPLIAFTAIIGDLFGYYLGRRFGYLIINRFTRKVGLTESRLQYVKGFLNKWGMWFVFLTRWLITPIGIPVNFMAGILKYQFKRFFLIVVLGEFIWAGMYIYLGYLFGANWQVLLDYIDTAPLLLVLLFSGIGITFIAFKMRRSR